MTWRSIRTTLEDGEVNNNQKHLQFLASIVTAYPCLDIWFRSAGLNSIQIQIYYMQCDSGFVAQDPWERNGERPRFYEQITGTWSSVRGEIISALPYLSRLSDEKRNGLANYGAKQPYAGGGLLFDIDGSGDLVIQGRYGTIRVEVGNIVLPFEALQYDFQCCEAVVTVDSSYLDGGGGGGGAINIFDGVPGTNRTDRYYPPEAIITMVASYGMVDQPAPYAYGDFFMIVNNWNWPAGTEIFVPQGAPVATPLPTDLSPPSQTAVLNNWSIVDGQAYFFSTEEKILPQVSDENGVKTYELASTLGFPTYVTSERFATARLDSYPIASNAQYRTEGNGSNQQSGLWRMTVAAQPDGDDRVDISFIPDDGTYGAAFLDGPKDIPGGDNAFVGWKAGAADGYGVRSTYAAQNAGASIHKSFNLNVDSIGDNTVPQGDFPSKTTPSSTFRLEAEQWRSTLTVSWT